MDVGFWLQWEGKGGKWCVRAHAAYKWALAVYLVSMMGLDLADLHSIGAPDRWVRIAKWPVLLTSWNTTALTLQAILSVVLLTRHRISEPSGLALSTGKITNIKYC
jgi:hypothetical protein